MEASKVSVSPKTLNNTLLTKKQRMQLRREKIMDYIRSKPAGEPILTSELAEVSQDSSWKTRRTLSNMSTFLKKMELVGLIDIEEIPGSFARRYSVLTDAKVITPGREEPTPATAPQLPTIGDIEKMAQEFAWAKNSDSLREFVDWAKGKAIDQLIGRQ